MKRLEISKKWPRRKRKRKLRLGSKVCKVESELSDHIILNIE